MRIKNRLDPAFDSSESGGYRDVSLNLRLCSAATRSAAIDTHVCEVQLVLRGMHEIKVRTQKQMARIEIGQADRDR